MFINISRLSDFTFHILNLSDDDTDTAIEGCSTFLLAIAMIITEAELVDVPPHTLG